MNNNNKIFIEPPLPPILDVLDEYIGNKKKRTIKIIDPELLINPTDFNYYLRVCYTILQYGVNNLNDNNLQFSEEDITLFGRHTSVTDDDNLDYDDLIRNYNYRVLKYYYNYICLIHYLNTGININDTENINKLIEILKNLYKLIYYNYNYIIPATIEMINSNEIDLKSRNTIISDIVLELLPGIDGSFKGISNILRQEKNNNRKTTSSSNNTQIRKNTPTSNNTQNRKRLLQVITYK